MLVLEKGWHDVEFVRMVWAAYRVAAFNVMGWLFA